VDENVVNHFSIIALTAREYGALITELARTGIVGGQTYDALHLKCAEKSGAENILTFNVRHFVGLAPHLSSRIAAPI
jgi:hypothetical protein